MRSAMFARHAVQAARVIAAGLVAVTTLVPSPACGGTPIEEFYQRKKLATTREALARAEENLTAVRPGMTETEFLEAMKMEVLAHYKSPYDVRLDGYLLEASRIAGLEAGKDERRLVFGWTSEGLEVPRFEVRLRARKVAEIIHLEPPAEESVLVAAGSR